MPFVLNWCGDTLLKQVVLIAQPPQRTAFSAPLDPLEQDSRVLCTPSQGAACLHSPCSVFQSKRHSLYRLVRSGNKWRVER